MGMRKRHLFTYFTLSTIVSICFCCSNNKTNSTDVINDSIESKYRIDRRYQILSQLQQSADIVTTEVKIRKIAIYDSSKNEHFRWTDPSTWKIGEQKSVIPVEVTIKYGYDLREISVEDIKIADDSMAVAIFLPKPKIIDAGYNAKIDEGSITNISTGLRSKIGHEMQEEIRRKGYESVLKEDISSIVGSEVENNAKTLFESIIRSMGWEDVQILTFSKKYEKR